jgi:hypothetical protein
MFVLDFEPTFQKCDVRLSRQAKLFSLPNANTRCDSISHAGYNIRRDSISHAVEPGKEVP